MPRPLTFLPWLRQRRRAIHRPARPLLHSQPALEALEDRLAPSIGFTIPLGNDSAPAAALAPPVSFAALPSTSGIQTSVVSQRADSGLPPGSLTIYIDPVDFDLRSPTGERLQSLISQNSASNPFYRTDGVNGLLTVPGALGGRYQLQLTGTGAEPFRFSVTYVSSQGQATSYLFQGYLQGLSPLFDLDFGQAQETSAATTPTTSTTPSFPNTSNLGARLESLTQASAPAATGSPSPQAAVSLILADAAAATISSLLLAQHTTPPQGSALSIGPSPNLELSSTTTALRVATGLGTAISGGSFSATNFGLGLLSRLPQAARLTDEAEMSPAQLLEPETRLAGEPNPLSVAPRTLRAIGPEQDQLAAAPALVPPAEPLAAPPVPSAAEESEEAAFSFEEEAVAVPAPLPEPLLTRARAVTILLATVLAGGLQHSLVDRGARIAPTVPGRKPQESSAI